MNKQKWMNIYNSILRLRFYAYLESRKPSVINEFDTHFQEFVDTFGLNSNKDTVKFFGGQMLIGLSYLILVRTNEYIKNDYTYDLYNKYKDPGKISEINDQDEKEPLEEFVTIYKFREDLNTDVKLIDQAKDAIVMELLINGGFMEKNI